MTPESAKILSVISQKIIDMMNEIPEENKPMMKLPNYHLTLDYKGKVEDMSAYVSEIFRKKRPGSRLDLVKMNAWRSNVTGTPIPHLEIEK
ncbi:hypothetical protein KBC03_03970 [Patescibacteria group bacterium]|nr:hypothetical protein [Patescibacteria group bacterium]